VNSRARGACVGLLSFQYVADPKGTSSRSRIGRILELTLDELDRVFNQTIRRANHEQIKMDSGAAFLYPMPMVLVVCGRRKANFMAAAWVTRVNFKPPLMLIALGPTTQQRNRGKQSLQHQHPGCFHDEKTDYCGLVSGGKTDKSEIFDVFYGELANAPLIKECRFLCRAPSTKPSNCPSMCFTLESPRKCSGRKIYDR